MAYPTDRLVADIARGKLSRDNDPALWDSLGRPCVRTFPGPDDLRYTPLRVIHGYWSGLPRVDGVAQQTRVEPEAIVPALGYVMLLDVIDGGQDFHYALFGSKIANVAGFDMTRKRLSEVPTTSPARRLFHAGYLAVVRHRTPLLLVQQAPDSIMIGSWHRLVLPLGRGAEVLRLLVCSVPVDPEGMIK